MFLVLGAVTVIGLDGRVVALSDRQRSLLASLLARAGAVVSVDNLVDLVWPEDPPRDPVAALHNQVSRLRRTMPFTRIETVAPGHRLAAGPDDVDSQRFDRLVRADTAGSLSEALSLWHGAAYAEFAESPVARFEAIRLEEARRQATERWHELCLDEGSPDLPALEAFATEHPLRERAHLVRMRALYACGRQADALAAYQRYADRLADELGLEPSAAMQELQLRILRHNVAPPTPLRAMRVSHVAVGDRRIAVATVGNGQPLIALPGWVSNIDVIAAGRDPRSSIFQRLVGTRALVMYDRCGTGRSPGPVEDFGLDASVAELAAVAIHAGAPADLLAMSQAGPVAVALAATRPTWCGDWCSSGPTPAPPPYSHAQTSAPPSSRWCAVTGGSAPSYSPTSTGLIRPTQRPTTWPRCCETRPAPTWPPDISRPSTPPTSPPCCRQ